MHKQPSDPRRAPEGLTDAIGAGSEPKPRDTDQPNPAAQPDNPSPAAEPLSDEFDQSIGASGNTTQQIERSHSIRRKVNSGVWSIAMLISATSLILLFPIWQTSRQAEKLANTKAEMVQYGSQATLIETINQQNKLMAKQKEEI